MTESTERELSADRLLEVGRRVEGNISNNEAVFLSIEDANTIRETLIADWSVFQKGVSWELEGEVIEVPLKEAETGRVLNARALLLLGALGQEKFMQVIGQGVVQSLDVKGGGIWKGSTRELTAEEAIAYAKDFMDLSCDVKSFRFGKEVSDERKNVLYRIEAAVNVMYYVLAIASLSNQNPDAFEAAQRDWLFSGNIRFPILKGIERSKNAEDRVMIPGFAQMAPIRHLPPGCLEVMMKLLA